jgi:hypothetical protein
LRDAIAQRDEHAREPQRQARLLIEGVEMGTALVSTGLQYVKDER